MSEIGGEQALSALANFALSKHRDASSAAFKLGQIGGTKSAETLLKYLAQGGEYAHQAISYLDSAQAERILNFLKSGHPKSASVIWYFEKVKYPPAIPVLIDVIKSSNTHNMGAVSVLEKYGDMAKPEIYEFMCSGHPRSIYGAIILGRWGNQIAVDKLLAGFDDSQDDNIKENIAKALVTTRDSRAIPPAIEVLKRNSKKGDLAKLLSLWGEEVVDPLIAEANAIICSNNTFPMGLSNILWALGKTKSKKANDYLIEQLKSSYDSSDKDLKFRRELGYWAITSLQEIGSPESVPYLLNIFNLNPEPGFDMRPFVAATAIGTFGRAALEPLLALLEKDCPNKSYVAKALGHVRAEESVMPLINTLEERAGSEYNYYVLAALTEIGSAEAVGPITHLIKKVIKKSTIYSDLERNKYEVPHEGTKESKFIEKSIESIMNFIKIEHEELINLLVGFLPYRHLNGLGLKVLNKIAAGSIKDKIEPALFNFLEDWELQVFSPTHSAFEILGKIGDEKTLQHLQTWVNSSYGEYAYNAIESIHHRHKPTTY